MSSSAIEDSELEPAHLKMLIDCDFIVGFVVRHNVVVDGNSQFNYNTAFVIAACLAELSGGTVNEPQCGLYFTGDAVLAEVRLLFSDKTKGIASNSSVDAALASSTIENHSNAAYTRSIRHPQTNLVKRFWSNFIY